MMPGMLPMPMDMDAPALVGLFCKVGPLPMNNLDVKVNIFNSLTRVVMV